MVANQNKWSENNSINRIWIGVVTSVGISLVISMLLAVAIIQQWVGESVIEYLSPAITLIAALIGCFAAGRKVNQKLAVVIAATGAIYLLLLVGTGVLLFDGGFHNLWMSLLSITIACVISCAICIRGKGIKRKRKSAIR